jgi:hypothetical protein
MMMDGLSINIHEREGLYDLKEVRAELQTHYSSMDTHSLSDHVLWLKGRKAMLRDVLEYFDRIIGE